MLTVTGQYGGRDALHALGKRQSSRLVKMFVSFLLLFCRCLCGRLQQRLDDVRSARCRVDHEEKNSIAQVRSACLNEYACHNACQKADKVCVS